MSALRQSLKRPHPWLLGLSLLILLAVTDTLRAPGNELSGRAYVGGVQLYQRWGRPLIAVRIRCRYLPSCSDYSIDAVRRHGIVGGLILSWRRIRACTPEVPEGTLAPVP